MFEKIRFTLTVDRSMLSGHLNSKYVHEMYGLQTNDGGWSYRNFVVVNLKKASLREKIHQKISQMALCYIPAKGA